jgi:hypothetical protein
MFRSVAILFSLVLSVSASGCSSQVAAPVTPAALRATETPLNIPSEPPSIRGQITEIDELGRIRVEVNPAEDHGSDKAIVRITETTRIIDAYGASVSADRLRVGTIVAVWFDGPVAESYPVQTSGGVIQTVSR